MYCALAVTHSKHFKRNVEDAIYNEIHIVLKNEYFENKLVDCMMEGFQEHKIADKFYTPDLLIDQEKLAQVLEPYIKEYSDKCTKKFTTDHIYVHQRKNAGVLSSAMNILTYCFCLFVCLLLNNFWVIAKSFCIVTDT